MDAKHTLGPWNVDTAARLIIAADGIPVAGCVVSRMTSQDANLIAAAPELLESLKAIVKYNTALPDGLLEQATAAIAKATSA